MRIATRRVVAILRTPTGEEAERIAERLIAAGLDVVEIPLTVPDAYAAIERLASRHPDALIGAGTVMDARGAQRALDAGAQFLLSPVLRTEVIPVAHRNGAAAVAGAFTPTEIDTAMRAGADLVKLFPADRLTPADLRIVRAALPRAPLLPTGGIDASTAAGWLDAGAVAVGVGGMLVREPERAGELLAAVSRSG